MEKIHVIGKITLTPSQHKRLYDLGVEYFAEFDPVSRTDFDEILKRIGNATIVLDNVSSPLPKQVLEKCSQIKFIQTWSTGTDHIDLAYAKSREIRVANVSDYSTEAVAEKTIGALLLEANDFIAANKDVRDGHWNYQGFAGAELKGKILLTVGDGRSARRISELAKAFGMEVINANSGTSKTELNQHIAKANFVTINCPLNERTHHLIGREQFDVMSDVILVNYARGGIVDETALLAALDSGKVAFAALDVFEKEPPEKSNPLLNHPKVFVTPHCAWNTRESIVNLTDRCIENIEKFLKGQLDDFIV